MKEGIGERHLRVARTARLFFLGEPGRATRDLWAACHWYGQLAASFAPALEALRSDERVVVAPEALSRFYPMMRRSGMDRTRLLAPRG